MTTETLAFKPQTASLTAVLIDTDNAGDLQTRLQNKLASAPKGFFTGTALVADLQAVPEVSVAWLRMLKKLFQDQGLLLVGLAHHRFTAEQLIPLALADITIKDTRPAPTVTAKEPVKAIKPEPAPTPAPASPVNDNVKTKVVRQTIRSGQRIYARGADLIVIGTVGAGAEVIADGNVHILGSLRGRAFAGASGNEQTHIFCNELAAELISIAGNYQNMEQLEGYRGAKNCLISLNANETMRIDALS